MTTLIYGLTAIALLTAAWAARGVFLALCDDFREDLTYAARRFRGLRIVVTRHDAGRPSRREGQPSGGAVIAARANLAGPASAPLSSTNGHRLRLVTDNYHLSTPITPKGERHGC